MFLEHKLRETQRGIPFILGPAAYRVRKPAPSYLGELPRGEVIVYRGATYGHYDGVSVYVFENGAGGVRTWVLGDDESAETWTDVFEPLG